MNISTTGHTNLYPPTGGAQIEATDLTIWRVFPECHDVDSHDVHKRTRGDTNGAQRSLSNPDASVLNASRRGPDLFGWRSRRFPRRPISPQGVRDGGIGLCGGGGLVPGGRALSRAVCQARERVPSGVQLAVGGGGFRHEWVKRHQQVEGPNPLPPHLSQSCSVSRRTAGNGVAGAMHLHMCRKKTRLHIVQKKNV